MVGRNGLSERFVPLNDVELWLVRRGVPQVIDDYRATTDVFTRMVPYFALIFLLGAFGSFGDRFEGWAQLGVLVVAVAVLVAAAVLVNRLRGRRMFALPDTIGIAEVGLFLVGSPLVALAFAQEGHRQERPLVLLGINIGLLVVGYVATSYGLLPMIRWGGRQMVREIRGLMTLLAQTLPLLLLFATFIFINAEMWQVAHGMTAPLAIIVIGLLAAISSGFLALKLPTEVSDLQRFSSWAEIATTAKKSEAPIEIVDLPPDPPLIPELGRRERLNMSLLIFIAEAVQMVLVALVIGLFYVVFGLLTVRKETILQWTEITEETFDPLREFSLFGAELVMTRELFLVAGFIAAISALQFATSQLTDQGYREQFSADVEAELREVMAVRAAYLFDVNKDGRVGGLTADRDWPGRGVTPQS